MPTVPDDLPRSPSGRVPQWVIDEAAGHTTTTTWRPYTTPLPPPPPPRRRRTGQIVGAAAVLIALGGAWLLTSGIIDVPAITAAVTSQLDTPGPARPATPPSAEVVALADEAHLTAEGRELFYGATPVLMDAQTFAGQCDAGHSSGPVAGGTVGCYRPDGTIAVFAPADPRLRGFVVETVAHELLHVAWETLPAEERLQLAELLEAEVAPLPADAEIRAQIAGSVRDQPQNRPTELFAYVGTQIWRDGGLAPQLEATYARFVTDRGALVGVHTAFAGQIDQMSVDIKAGYDALAATEGATGQQRAQLDADVTAREFYRERYQAQVAEVEALPAAERERLLLSWTWWDGTDLPMAKASKTLAAAADLLARDDRDMPVREASVAAAEAADAAERARLDALVVDFNALQAQMDPDGTP